MELYVDSCDVAHTIAPMTEQRRKKKNKNEKEEAKAKEDRIIWCARAHPPTVLYTYIVLVVGGVQ